MDTRRAYWLLCVWLVGLLISGSFATVSLAEPASAGSFNLSANFHQRLLALNHFGQPRNLLRDMTPVNVNVSVANNNYVTTFSICNNSGSTIPLKSIAFYFQYTASMPSTIWGNPWLDWRLVSQNGNQVTLKGGTPWVADFPSDPNCNNPLTISFNADPNSALPTAPFVFMTDTGGSNTQTGSLTVSVGAAPASGLSNPVVTVAGQGTSQQQTVSWGSSWQLSSLSPGTYTVSGNSLTSGTTTYTATSVTAQVTANNTASATLNYQASGSTTGKVTVTLNNAPSSTVPITLTGTKSTINQTVGNNTVLTLPQDTYSISSTVAGYTATAAPNPLTVPTNTALQITYTANSTGTGARTINFVNQCPFPVWFGFISGATPNKNGGQCGSDADCYQGSTCVDRGAGGKQCFWKNPAPANNNFQLAANGGTNSVAIPIYQGGLSAIWSGAVAGRTNCTASGCETADCGGKDGACPPGRGFGQPATQAEFTFGMNSPDYYDVEFINGFNLPVSMAPVLTSPKTGGPYDCGSPGSTVAQPPMGASSWNFSPPSVDYNWVRAGGNACTSNADCASGSKCGLSFNPGQSSLLKKTCGKLLGYWTANQVCGIQGNYGAPFNCQMQLPAPQNDLKLSNLYGCVGVGSCYQPGASTRCCGCANWDTLGVGVPPSPYTTQCINKNPNWVQYVQPVLMWLKQACPSCYTYPFDDMSSTFICTINKSQNGQQINSVDYTITFCPGGATGGLSS